ncbi:MAG: YjdF family protein [Acutalibacteraceae bacterium]
MYEVSGKLTVYFEDPFWVGVFERTENGKLAVSKVTFGAEPKDAEVYQFILRHFYDLRFSPPVAVKVDAHKKNPKRMQREAKKQMQDTGIGTKSQQALKLQQEQSKAERKVKSREEKMLEAERKFELRRQKRKDKHKGR